MMGAGERPVQMRRGISYPVRNDQGAGGGANHGCREGARPLVRGRGKSQTDEGQEPSAGGDQEPVSHRCAAVSEETGQAGRPLTGDVPDR